MLPFYLMALPGFIYMIINNYLPMFGIVIAFKKLNFKKGIWGSPWCGFDNFKFLFASADAWIITRNTIFYNIAFFLVGNVTAIAVAILINEIRKKTLSEFDSASLSDELGYSQLSRLYLFVGGNGHVQ